MGNEERIADILREWHERRKRGEEWELDALLAEHADLADQLRPLLEALLEFDQALPMTGRLPERKPGIIGEYRIIRELGRGGMGVVYEAEQPSMDRKVALKLLLPVFTESSQAVKRFHREAKAAGRLHHTNIVQAHTMGKHKGYWYYTMEYVEGGSLSGMIEELRSPASDVMAKDARLHFLRVAEMFTGVADALDEAHKAGIIHRDIKPGNLLLDREDTLKIVDFGMARLDESPSLTLSGEVLGTPVYMSPEQAQAKLSDIDHRTDIYSLGATLYEVLTLRPPFKGKSALDIRSQIIAQDPPPPRKIDPRIPRDLATIATKAMEKDRTARYQTAKEMARDLARFVEGVPIIARSIGPVGRAWRKVKRNKVKSTLTACILMLLVAGTLLTAVAVREAEERREAQYENLLIFGQDAIAYSIAGVSDVEWHSPMMCNERARTYFNQAIGIMPERPEAYWLRVLAPGGTLEEKLEDLDKAENSGLSTGTVRWLRAYILVADKSYVSKEAGRAIEIASAFKPDGPIDYFAKAWIFSRKKERKEAINLFGIAIKNSNPRSSISYLALRHRAWLLIEVGDLRGALRDLETIKFIRQQSPAVDIQIASIKKKLEETEAGEKRFKETMEKAETVEDWYALCLACCWSQEYDWLDRASDKAIQYHRSVPAILFWRADAFHHNNEPEKEIEVCDWILEIDPSDPSALGAKASALEKLEKNEEANGLYKKALDISPNHLLIMMSLGRVYRNMGQYDQSIEILEKVLRTDRTYTDALYNLGLTHQHMGDLNKAKECYLEALKIDPGYAEVKLDLGNVYHAEAKKIDREKAKKEKEEALAKAADTFQDLVATNPKYWEAWYNLGNMRIEQGKFQEALEAFEEVNRIYEEPAAYVNIGWIYLNRDDFKEALAAFDRAKDLNPNDILVYLNLAEVYRELGRYKDALEAAQAASNLAGPHYRKEAFCIMGEIQAHLGLLQEAEVSFRKSLEEGKKIALFHLGCVLQDLNCCKESVEVFERLLKSHQHHCKGYMYYSKSLQALGLYAEARDAMKQAHKHGMANKKWVYPTEKWLSDCERMVEFSARLPEYLENGRYPDAPEDQAILAQVCLARNRPVTAASLFETALTARPELGEDTWNNYYFLAAQAAVLSASGKGHEDEWLHENAKSSLRRLALDWLNRDMAVCIEAGEEINNGSFSIQRALRIRMLHPNLSSIHDPDALAALSDNEREAFEDYWTTVEKLLTSVF